MGNDTNIKPVTQKFQIPTYSTIDTSEISQAANMYIPMVQAGAVVFAATGDDTACNDAITSGTNAIFAKLHEKLNSIFGTSRETAKTNPTTQVTHEGQSTGPSTAVTENEQTLKKLQEKYDRLCMIENKILAKMPNEDSWKNDLVKETLNDNESDDIKKLKNKINGKIEGINNLLNPSKPQIPSQNGGNDDSKILVALKQREAELNKLNQTLSTKKFNNAEELNTFIRSDKTILNYETVNSTDSDAVKTEKNKTNNLIGSVNEAINKLRASFQSKKVETPSVNEAEVLATLKTRETDLTAFKRYLENVKDPGIIHKALTGHDLYLEKEVSGDTQSIKDEKNKINALIASIQNLGDSPRAKSLGKILSNTNSYLKSQKASYDELKKRQNLTLDSKCFIQDYEDKQEFKTTVESYLKELRDLENKLNDYNIKIKEYENKIKEEQAKKSTIYDGSQAIINQNCKDYEQKIKEYKKEIEAINQKLTTIDSLIRFNLNPIGSTFSTQDQALQTSAVTSQNSGSNVQAQLKPLKERSSNLAIVLDTLEIPGGFKDMDDVNAFLNRYSISLTKATRTNSDADIVIKEKDKINTSIDLINKRKEQLQEKFRLQAASGNAH